MPQLSPDGRVGRGAPLHVRVVASPHGRFFSPRVLILLTFFSLRLDSIAGRPRLDRLATIFFKNVRISAGPSLRSFSSYRHTHSTQPSLLASVRHYSINRVCDYRSRRGQADRNGLYRRGRARGAAKVGLCPGRDGVLAVSTGRPAARAHTHTIWLWLSVCCFRSCSCCKC